MSVAVEITTAQWVRDAACRNSDLFIGPVREPALARQTRESDAKQICARCPVRMDCLEYALRVHERLGIWGGLDAIERRALSETQTG